MIEKAKRFEENEIKIPIILEILVKLKSQGISLDFNNEELTVDTLINKLTLNLTSGRKGV